MARTNQKGRSKAGPRFISLFLWVYDSPAYLSLKPGPRAILLALLRRFNGMNNGRIGLGVREAAAECCIRDKDTAHAYFRELEHKGFIVAVKRGGFNMKNRTDNRATEWRLTWLPAGEAGSGVTKEFQNWKLAE